VEVRPPATWAPGRQVLFRYVRDGRAFWALPARVARASPNGLALWIAPGSPMRRPVPLGVPVEDLAAGRWEPVETEWFGEGVLMLRRPGTRHSLWLFWNPGWDFRGWYVNLEDWWRTVGGIDAYDHQLDVWVYPDGSWAWKDEDHLAESIERGIFTPGEAADIRAEGERVLDDWPFPTGWEQWRPDPTWPLPALPGDWDRMP
jgi:uncharacterized protein